MCSEKTQRIVTFGTFQNETLLQVGTVFLDQFKNAILELCTKGHIYPYIGIFISLFKYAPIPIALFFVVLKVTS